MHVPSSALMSEQTSTISSALARFVADLSYDAIPAAVRERAKLHLLDSVGVALASSSFEFARIAYAALSALGSGEHVAIGLPGRLALRDAILVNGMLVHGLEFDDTSISGRVHASAFCVPAALGMGAHVGASGRELLTAYIAGMECVIRIGKAAHGAFSQAGFNTVGLLGAFGAALIAGKLLRLDADKLAMAQGLAFSTAAGTREFAADQSWSKRFEAGWPAASGVTTAMLAAHGYVSARTVYEGKFGLFKTHLGNASPDLDLVTRDLGTAWQLPEVLIKLRPSCFFNHPIINSTLALVEQHDLDPEQIRSIKALVPAAGVHTVCEPRPQKVAPRDLEAAQFSVHYSAAAAAVRRRFGLDEMRPEALRDPAILALAERVEYAADPQSNFPAHYCGGVEITTTDGRVLSSREDVNAGSVERPLDASVIEAKFLDNAAHAMSRARAHAAMDALLRIDAAEDIRPIVAGLSARGDDSG